MGAGWGGVSDGFDERIDGRATFIIPPHRRVKRAVVRVLDQVQQLHPVEQRLEPLVRDVEPVDQALGLEDVEGDARQGGPAARRSRRERVKQGRGGGGEGTGQSARGRGVPVWRRSSDATNERRCATRHVRGRTAPVVPSSSDSTTHHPRRNKPSEDNVSVASWLTRAVHSTKKDVHSFAHWRARTPQRLTERRNTRTPARRRSRRGRPPRSGRHHP